MAIYPIPLYSEDKVEILLSRLFDGIDDKDATPEKIKERIAAKLIIGAGGHTYYLDDLQAATLEQFNEAKIKLDKSDTSDAGWMTVKYSPNLLVHNKPLAEVLYEIHTSKREKRFHFDLPLCPITSTVLLTPCITHSEQSIERYALEEHVSTHGENPFNRQKLSKDKILRNFALSSIIYLRFSALVRECLDLYDTEQLHSDLEAIKENLETASSFYNNKINELETKRTYQDYYLRQYHQQFGHKNLVQLNALSHELLKDTENLKIRKNIFPVASGILSSLSSLIPFGVLVPPAVLFVATSFIPIVPIIIAGVGVSLLALGSALLIGKFIYDKVDKHYEKKLAAKNSTRTQLGYYITSKERDINLASSIHIYKQAKENNQGQIDYFDSIKAKLPAMSKVVKEDKNVLSRSKDTLLAAPAVEAAREQCAARKGFRR